MCNFQQLKFQRWETKLFTLYADPITVNCRKVMAGLEFLGVDFERVHVDFFAGEHKEPAFTRLNPNASLPVLTDGDLVLWESNAILQFAADKHECSQAYPKDSLIRADIHRWMLWEAANWFACCYVYMVENCAKPLMDAEPDEEILAAQGERFHQLAMILDERLADQAWLCGDKPTIADIAVAAPMHMYSEAKLPVERHKNLMRWMKKNIESLPAWQNTHVGPGFTLVTPDNSD